MSDPVSTNKENNQRITNIVNGMEQLIADIQLNLDGVNDESAQKIKAICYEGSQLITRGRGNLRPSS